MIELSVSGRSEGLVASSAVKFFWVSDRSITKILSDKLRDCPEIEMPFQILGIYVEAISHNVITTHQQSEIGVKEVRRLSKFHTGQVQKIFELTLSEANFYSLHEGMRRRNVAEAFKRVAAAIKVGYADDNGERLATLISSAANEYLSGSD